MPNYESRVFQGFIFGPLMFMTLREKYPNAEFFGLSIFLYSFQIQENTDQRKLRI